MMATISLPPTTEADDRLSSLSLRLSLAPTDSAPALLDGAWWPRSRDLEAELPSLTAVLDPLWGRITRVTVNPTQWPVIPRKVPVAGHVVNVGWFRTSRTRTNCCCSPTAWAAGTSWSSRRRRPPTRPRG